MVSRILRSPLTSATMFLMALISIYLLKKNWDSGQFIKAVETGEPLTGLNIFALFCAAMIVLWVLLVIIHNRKHPKERINVWLGLSEIREVDEGQQWITFKACRNVYIYYSMGLPTAAIVLIFLPADYAYSLILFGLLGLGQYVVYGLTRWKYSRI